MTRKHFKELAAIIQEHYTATDNVTVQVVLERVARDLARFCREQSGAFDRERFLDACGMK